MANAAFTFGNILKFFFLNIFDPQLVESTGCKIRVRKGGLHFKKHYTTLERKKISVARASLVQGRFLKRQC